MTRKTSTRKTGPGTRKTMEGQIRQVVEGGDDVSRARARRATRAPQAQGQSAEPDQVELARRAHERQEYDRRELAEANQRLEKIRRAPLADRKAAQATFLNAIRTMPEHIADMIGWMIDGNYGHGEMVLARRVLASPRMNRAAALTQMAGAFEWGSPEDLSRAAWHQLSSAEKTKLDRAVQAALKHADKAAAESIEEG